MLETDYDTVKLTAEAEAVVLKVLAVLADLPFGNAICFGETSIFLMPLPEQKFDLSAISIVDNKHIANGRLPALYEMELFIQSETNSDALVALGQQLDNPTKGKIEHWPSIFESFYGQVAIGAELIEKFNQVCSPSLGLTEFRKTFPYGTY